MGGSQYPEAVYSLLTLDNPDVVLWSLKPAEDGIEQGIIARVWNMSANAGNLTLTYAPAAITSAKRTTHVETPIENAMIDAGRLTSAINEPATHVSIAGSTWNPDCHCDADSDSQFHPDSDGDTNTDEHTDAGRDDGHVNTYFNIDADSHIDADRHQHTSRLERTGAGTGAE